MMEEAETISGMLKEHVAAIYEKYQTSFPQREMNQLEITIDNKESKTLQD